MQNQLPSGWNDASQTGLDQQLAREVSDGHPLFGVRTRPVARAGSRDDVLFELENGPDGAQYAVVHLTWGGTQPPPWPSTVLYDSFDEWHNQVRRARLLYESRHPGQPSRWRRIRNSYYGGPLRTWVMLAILMTILLPVFIIPLLLLLLER